MLKYIVLDREDVASYLSEFQESQLEAIISDIKDGREYDKLPKRKGHIILDADVPYAWMLKILAANGRLIVGEDICPCGSQLIPEGGCFKCASGCGFSACKLA